MKQISVIIVIIATAFYTQKLNAQQTGEGSHVVIHVEASSTGPKSENTHSIRTPHEFTAISHEVPHFFTHETTDRAASDIKHHEVKITEANRYHGQNRINDQPGSNFAKTNKPSSPAKTYSPDKNIQKDYNKQDNSFNTKKKEIAQVTKNLKQGTDFEKVVVKNLKDAGHTHVVEQLTIKPNGAKGKVRLDVVSKKNGNLVITDAKSSATAPFTKNQKPGYPALKKNGGVVKGNKGAATGYPAGTVIPPTEVTIIRKI